MWTSCTDDDASDVLVIVSAEVRDAGAAGGSRCVSVTIFSRSRYAWFRSAWLRRPSSVCCSRSVALRCALVRADSEHGGEQYLKRRSHDLQSRNVLAQSGQRRRESSSSMSRAPPNWTSRVDACDTRGAVRIA
jgi:hypothetical protein